MNDTTRADEMILVPRAELLAWAKAWLDDYGPNDGTDCVTPFDTYLMKTPAEAQPGEWVLVPREPTEAMRTAHAMYGDTSDWWQAVIAAAPKPPSAPVGVEAVEDALQKWLDWCNEHNEEPEAKSGARIAIEALAQQPAAAGEEIMVNAVHDVYTLPLQPSGLLSGPRFVVHVPGPEQPAAVDGWVLEIKPDRNGEIGVWAVNGDCSVWVSALSDQPGGSDNDR